ncbi:hypothetical protein CDAR_13051 [Caerostris darwini]|uniref:Uncharacterized protein n=1 Tax=Caerostris darwini TaxID=1538125 RepID=A0AAV4Q739_9ARAC|nr:hypothetical protein CDAR_13051 [Caerostris darwini]
MPEAVAVARGPSSAHFPIGHEQVFPRGYLPRRVLYGGGGGRSGQGHGSAVEQWKNTPAGVGFIRANSVKCRIDSLPMHPFQKTA